MRVRSGLPSLRYNDEHALLKEAFARSTRESFRVVEYSVQSNHLHLLVEARDAESLGRGMIGLSVRIVRRLHKLWGSFGKLFADRYHARVLRTPREVRNALVYVINNARKHGAWKAGHVDPYSSGAWFGGWKASPRPAANSAFVKTAESGPRFLARARTWLLSFGWQRHGLIDPRECPAGA
jgi:REP element-mobilizing transposase RayT